MCTFYPAKKNCFVCIPNTRPRFFQMSFCTQSKGNHTFFIRTIFSKNMKLIFCIKFRNKLRIIPAWVSKKVINICKCNYLLFTKLPWPEDSKETFLSSSQAATCPPVYHTQQKLHNIPLVAECQARKLWIPIFIVFGLIRPRIEPESIASVADILSTRPLNWTTHLLIINIEFSGPFVYCCWWFIQQ